MKSFIAGGAGFIGSHVAHRLLKEADCEHVTIYDNFTENSVGVALLTFEDPSSDLKSELTSSNLFCNSPSAQAQLGNTRPQIWAPSPFSGGSSYSHWDENIFSSGNINSLMTPQIGRGEANHNPALTPASPLDLPQYSLPQQR